MLSWLDKGEPDVDTLVELIAAALRGTGEAIMAQQAAPTLPASVGASGAARLGDGQVQAESGVHADR